jgi:uncharacterized RDD family membrane protein YckC
MDSIIRPVFGPRPAGFWIRAVAALIDFAVFGVVKFSLGVIAARALRMDLGGGSVVVACTLLFVALYVIVLHALEGQTLGKLAVGVRVVGPEGGPPPLGAAVLRFLGYFASLAPVGLGFAMAGLRADRRALHDLLASTRVERLARTAPPPAPTAPLAPAPPPA